MTQDNVATDIAVIKNELKNITATLVRIESCSSDLDKRVTDSEKKIAEQGTKIGLFAGIQVLFTAAVGGIISYFRV